ncbi:hypothetical protein LguiA_019535 [Lonicera macranthoides]
MDRVMCERKKRIVVLCEVIRSISNVIGMFYMMIYVCAMVQRKRCHTSSTSRTQGRNKRAKISDELATSLEEMALLFKKFVENTNANLDKLANALCMSHEMELGKKVVDELSSIDSLTQDDVLTAASMIIGDTPKCSLFLTLKPSQKLTWVQGVIRKN